MNVHPSRETPLFSVVLPTFNREAMLSRAVSSVLRQSLQDFELIVVDDGSTEASGTGLPDDPRIRFIRNVTTLGVAQCRNIGVAAAKGRYISFLDDDDEYLSSFLSSTHARLKHSSETVGASWCGVKFIDDSQDGTVSESIMDFPILEDERTVIRALFSIGISFGFTGKAECIRKVGPFDSGLKVASDTDYFFRMLVQGFVPVIVPGVHVVCHIHLGDRLTNIGWHAERIRTWEKWLFIQYSDFLDQHPDLKRGLQGYVESLKKEMGGGRDHEQTSRVRRLQAKFVSRFPVLRCWLARVVGQ